MNYNQTAGVKMEILTVLIVLFYINSVFMQQDSYRAAVLEHAPRIGATSADNFNENVRDYKRYMQQASDQNVQIIVFPEDGLTGRDTDVRFLEPFSTEVPDPNDNISPCERREHSNYAKFLVDLSCATRDYRIYSVINLIEWTRESSSDKKIYHNTNIVFDRRGVVIARYRKINLFDEPHYLPGTHTVSTFKTDFGVTFGMFICFDIMFKSPAIDVLSNPAVTDIVYSVAWFSELPFFAAASVQHGYAKAHRVNLLAAGMNDPNSRNGGSGIYLANGRIAETYLSGIRGSKLIIQNVPKIGERLSSSDFCQSSSGLPHHQLNLEELQDINSFQTMLSDLSYYTFKSVNLDNKEISETICSGTSKFCCSFNIIVNKYPNSHPNYVYKLAALYGVRKVSLTKTVGLSNCGLVACLNDSNTSCGGRHGQPPMGLIFESVSVKGTFHSKDSQFRPATLNFDLKPSTNYQYCTKSSNGEVEISLTTMKPHDSLLTFGIMGRVFSNDDKPVGAINSAAFYGVSTYLVLILSVLVLVFTLQK